MAFQGSLKELPLPDIIQLVSVSGKTGVFSLRRNGDSSSGEIYLRGRQIVHAHAGDLQGEEAMYELAIWPEGEFVFTPGKETELTTIQKSNTNLLMEAARRIDEWQILSKRIPSTRLVPVFTQQATTTCLPDAAGVGPDLQDRRAPQHRGGRRRVGHEPLRGLQAPIWPHHLRAGDPERGPP